MKRIGYGVLGVLLLASLMMLDGCGSSGSGGSSSTGTLKVAITDKMSDDCENVVVTIKEIRAVPAGHEGDSDNSTGLPLIVRFTVPQTIDVLTLRFQAQLLGEAVIPTGNYTQLRLILAEDPNGNQSPVNYLTLKTDPTTKIPIKTPSGQQSGLKILGQFSVEPNRITAMMIDFNPDSAIVARGNGDYNFKPTGIRLVKMDSMMLAGYGTMTGTVSGQAWNGEAFLAVKQGTTTVASGGIFAHYTSGSYERTAFSAFVPAGDYKAFLSAAGFRTYSSLLTHVTSGAESLLGDITLQPTP